MMPHGPEDSNVGNNRVFTRDNRYILYTQLLNRVALESARGSAAGCTCASSVHDMRVRVEPHFLHYRVSSQTESLVGPSLFFYYDMIHGFDFCSLCNGEKV